MGRPGRISQRMRPQHWPPETIDRLLFGWCHRVPDYSGRPDSDPFHQFLIDPAEEWARHADELLAIWRARGGEGAPPGRPQAPAGLG